MKKRIINIFITTALICFTAFNIIIPKTINSSNVLAVENDELKQAEQKAAQDEAEEAVQEEVMPYLPEIPPLSDEYKIIETYETSWPDFLFYNIQYDKYDVFPHYVVNLSSSKRKIYEAPDTDSEYYGRLSYGYKLQTIALVEDADENRWYVVVYDNDDEIVLGYIQEDKVSKREFQLEEMNKYLQNVTGFQQLGHIVYVENYRYINGYPPRMPNGSYYDDFGYRRGQSIVGYYDSTMDGKFRYIPDGTLGIIEQVIEQTVTVEDIIKIDEKGIFTANKENTDETENAIEEYNKETEVTAVKLYIPSFGTSLWVEEKYINEDKDAPDVLNQAIIVDRLNQNIAVFEYDGVWKVISISYSSTGKVGEYSLPTPLGYYMAIEKKPKFDYVEDGTSTIVGFAPYAIRFSAGGYLHGVPMSYDFDESGKKVSPGYYVEYLSSIGTVPKSHMCVRNYTSHAEFMYNWVDISNCTVIVIE